MVFLVLDVCRSRKRNQGDSTESGHPWDDEEAEFFSATTTPEEAHCKGGGGQKEGVEVNVEHSTTSSPTALYETFKALVEAQPGAEDMDVFGNFHRELGALLKSGHGTNMR